MTFRIGLRGGSEKCAVCDLSPRAFRDTRMPDVVECARCGLPLNVESGSDGERTAIEATHVGMLELFREYWQATGNKISARPIAKGDLERTDRCQRLEQWLQGHPERLLQARLATLAPYAAITAVCVELRPGDPSSRSWSLILPDTGAGRALGMPFAATAFVPGTIVTLMSPVEAKPPPSPLAGFDGSPAE